MKTPKIIQATRYSSTRAYPLSIIPVPNTTNTIKRLPINFGRKQAVRTAPIPAIPNEEISAGYTALISWIPGRRKSSANIFNFSYYLWNIKFFYQQRKVKMCVYYFFISSRIHRSFKVAQIPAHKHPDYREWEDKNESIQNNLSF